MNRSFCNNPRLVVTRHYTFYQISRAWDEPDLAELQKRVGHVLFGHSCECQKLTCDFLDSHWPTWANWSINNRWRLLAHIKWNRFAKTIYQNRLVEPKLRKLSISGSSDYFLTSLQVNDITAVRPWRMRYTRWTKTAEMIPAAVVPRPAGRGRRSVIVISHCF